VPTGSASSPAAATTRRAALGVVLAGLTAVSACDTGRGEEDAAPGVSVGPDPDSAVVDGVVEELTGLVSLAGSVAAAYPRLARRARAFGELHTAHLEALGEDAPRATSPGRFSGPEAALTELMARERQAQRRLVDAAVSARSGTLARLLASMSAGTSQRLALENGPATATVTG
jgi:hypothetical protein